MNYKIIKNDTNYNLDDLTKLLNTSNSFLLYSDYYLSSQ